MTSNNNLFTAPIKHTLSQHLYGKVTLRRYHTVTCEGTCYEWEPFSDRTFAARPGESWKCFEARFEHLVEEEEAARTCQGHLVRYDEFRGMLRNYTYQPASDDRERDGTLTLIVLPWDDEAKQLTHKRTVKTRVFHAHFQGSSLYVTDGYGSTALEISLKQWEIDQR